MRIEELNITISEIDQALLRLYNAKEKGYTFFDFYNRLEKVLHLGKGADENYKKILRDYSSVFADLLHPVAFIAITVKDFNWQENTIVLTRTQHHTKKMGLKSNDVSMVIEPGQLNLYKDLKIGDNALHIMKQIEISNYVDYLDGVKYWDGDVKPDNVEMAEYFFLHQTSDLFKRNNLEMPNNPWPTFEKYVSWIKINDPVENDSKGFYASQTVFLLNELGFFNLDAVKDLTTENQGILVSAIIGKNQKNTTEFVRNKYTPPSKKLLDPVLKLMEDVGVKKNK